MPTPTKQSVAGGLPALVTLAVLLAGCGDTSREDYISELTRDGELTDEMAECIYVEIAGDQSVLDDIDENGAEDVSDDSVDTLKVAFAKCYLTLPVDEGGAGGESADTPGEDDVPSTEE